MTFVIAEIGVNHQGVVETAKRLIDASKVAGADAVKFQLFDSITLNRPEIGHLQLSSAQMAELADYCKPLGLEFMCTPFDVSALECLTPLVKRHKIASGCIANMPLLLAAKKSGKPCIISTGMSTQDDWRTLLSVFGLGGGQSPHQHTILHCTSAYPCPVDEVNLRAMDLLREYTGWHVGYSDHTDSIHVAIAAVALGATVIEKHITLDRELPGPDHKASVTPREFRGMCIAIRDIEKALGDGIKRPMPSEEPARKIWRS